MSSQAWLFTKVGGLCRDHVDQEGPDQSQKYLPIHLRCLEIGRVLVNGLPLLRNASHRAVATLATHVTVSMVGVEAASSQLLLSFITLYRLIQAHVLHKALMTFHYLHHLLHQHHHMFRGLPGIIVLQMN